MRVTANSTLVAFGKVNARTAAPLNHWRRVVKEARWTAMADAQATFSKSKVLDAERIQFEVGGGAFRLICTNDSGARSFS